MNPLLYVHDDSTPLRRFRYSLSVKRHPRSFAGLVRLLWYDFVIHPLFEGGERCQDCGRGYVLWRAPGYLWLRAMESPGGLLCPACFDRRIAVRGVRGGVMFIATPFLKSLRDSTGEEKE